jgi:hypothetical protein
VEPQVIDVTEVASRQVPVVIDAGFEPDVEVRRLVEAAREARTEFEARRRQKLKRLRGWAALGLFLVAPVAAAAALPELMVQAMPASVVAYEKLGYSINVYGLELRRIEQQHVTKGGATVLTIKGEIINTDSGTRKIPWLRFGLQDGSSAEVYSWTLDTGSRPLRPGESTSFVTRVAAPPLLAKNLQIRFAHADEIGSNAGP